MVTKQRKWAALEGNARPDPTQSYSARTRNHCWESKGRQNEELDQDKWRTHLSQKKKKNDSSVKEEKRGRREVRKNRSEQRWI